MVAFWHGTTMIDESLLMTERADGGIPEAPLLLDPVRIASVRSARLDAVFEEGRDWVLRDGKLALVPDSRVPTVSRSIMYPEEASEGLTMPKLGGGYVAYREGSFFHDLQIVVTYEHAPGAWRGPVPSYAGDKLRRTASKLRERQQLKLVVYGDSISFGANVSGWSGVPPYTPTWGEQTKRIWEARYGTRIAFANASLGGADALWGMANAERVAVSERPDLALVAFGMNDGAGDGAEPGLYRERIRGIVDRIREVRPEAEMILVGTTLANPETIFHNRQPDYYAELERLAAELPGVAAADMTGVHRTLLSRKRFADMTGNNINHPNDYLSRWYAQFVAGMLLKDASE